ncbi:unnamed protein product, partial [Tuber aestivum]
SLGATARSAILLAPVPKETSGLVESTNLRLPRCCPAVNIVERKKIGGPLSKVLERAPTRRFMDISR